MSIIRRIAREATLKWRNESRHILEKKIFPQIQGKRILLVGCEAYTKTYPRLLEKKRNEVWTIELLKERAQYGSKHHVTGDVTKASKYFEKKFFDIIFLVGIFGYGVNTTKKGEQTLKELSQILQKNGLLIIQWTNRPKKNMIEPKKLTNKKLYTPIHAFGIKGRYQTKKHERVWDIWKKNG